MHTIDIYGFKDYDFASIQEYLQIQEEMTYTIIRHKFALAPYSDNFELAQQYISALYIGEQLATLTPDFNYLVPAPYSKAPFSFQLTTHDDGALARVLAYLSRPLRGGGRGKITTGYEDDKSVFWKKVCQGTMQPACHGLYQIASSYLIAGL